MDYQGLMGQLRQKLNTGAGNPFYHNGQFSMLQGLQSLTGSGYQAGAFSPYGNPAYLDAMQKYLGSQRDAQVRRAQVGAQMYNPDDPMAAMYARTSAENGAMQAGEQAMAGARAQAGQQASGQYWDLLRAYMQPYLAHYQKQGPSASFAGYGVSAGGR